MCILKRFSLNITLLLVILLTMGFQYLPPLYHEILGLILLTGGIWHLALNRIWFSRLISGPWRILRFVQTIMNILLVASFLTSLTTGIIISNHVFRELWVGVELHRSIFIYQLHVSSSYFMVIFGGMHMGMHWLGLWSRIKKISVLQILETKTVLRLCILALIGYSGLEFAYLDRVGDRLLMKHIFGTEASQLPAEIYYIMLLCMMGLYAIAFYFIQKCIKGK